MKPPLSHTLRMHLFSMLFLLLFIIINIGYYRGLVFSSHLPTLLYVWLLEFIALGLAYELTEMTLSLLLQENSVPHVETLGSNPPVALLCCTCDDVDVDILRLLGNQTYSNLHVYILDDSQLIESQQKADSLGFTVVRRSSRAGYKAGNLNNWLFSYGSAYPYFAVADADSIFPDDFVEEMMKYAVHPDNSNTAIFESLIQSWNRDNEFAQLQSILTPLGWRSNLRVDNRFGSTLSAGHNNLYRTSVIKGINGFDENYLAEDHATSVAVLRAKSMCVTVPVISYERLPENLVEYSRRQARWAFQTFQLMSLDISGLCWNIRLKLLNLISSYLSYILAPIGMIFLVIHNLFFGLVFVETFSEGGTIEILVKNDFLLFWVPFLLLPLTIRIILSLQERVSIGDYLRNYFFQLTLFYSSMWPVILRLSKFWVRGNSRFDVTGKSSTPSMAQILRLGGPGFVLVWVTLLTITFAPILTGLNLVWCIPAALSPLIIHHFQKRKIWHNTLPG